MSVNSVIVGGRLVADPELRTTQSGTSVTSFRIASDKPYTKGQEKEANFFDVVAWSGTAEFITKYFLKGNQIIVEGELQSRTYEDKQGNKRKVVEVVANKAHFVDKKTSNETKPEKDEGGDVPDEEMPF